MSQGIKRELSDTEDSQMSDRKRACAQDGAFAPGQMKFTARFAAIEAHKWWTRPAWDIPASIGDFVEKVGAQEYKFTYPVGALKIFHRLCWAVPESITEVIVRVVCRDDYDGFCIHLAPEDREEKKRHAHCRTDKTWSDNMRCGKKRNFLVYLLSCDLHDFMTTERRSLLQIHEKILGILESDPSQTCAVCATPFDDKAKLWRLTSCEKKTCIDTMQLWPLDIRLSPLILDASVLDFLLCCCLVAGSHEGLPDNIDVNKVINSLPILRDCMPLNELLCGDRKDKKLQQEKRDFLSWLCKSFQGCIISAPPASAVPWGSELGHQFLMMNTRRDLQATFMKRKTAIGVPKGTVAFHGTANHTIFSVLTSTLFTQFDKALVGKAIYYADQPSYSIPYITSRSYRNPCVTTWTNSRFRGADLLVLFGLELTSISKPTPLSEGRTNTDGELIVRYIFLIPAQKTGVEAPAFKRWGPVNNTPTREAIDLVMSTTFGEIHADTLGCTTRSASNV
ncbi:hypothetical protein GQ53DRAFT_820081 [Thozetella sp. PMI_491]|nr:hypothetical protein GQ53DRAFT_820081 [Thozetella sp. PMI_491]